jgi:cell division protein FtsB
MSLHVGVRIMMITRQRRQSFVKRLWLPVLAAAFLSYFGYHAFHGAFGIWAMERLTIQAARLTVERDRRASMPTLSTCCRDNRSG